MVCMNVCVHIIFGLYLDKLFNPRLLLIIKTEKPRVLLPFKEASCGEAVHSRQNHIACTIFQIGNIYLILFQIEGLGYTYPKVNLPLKFVFYLGKFHEKKRKC